MREILDEIEIENTQKRFSKISMIVSIITLGLFGYLFSHLPKTIKASEAFAEPPLIIVIAIEVLCLIGVLMTILSFTRKEPSNWFKWVGGVLNILLFLLIAGSIVFARMA